MSLWVAVIFRVTAPGLTVAKETAAVRMKVSVTVIIDKLPLIKQERMRDFENIVQQYINNREWLESDDIPPFMVNVQLFLEDQPSNVEDRYRCSILVNGPDIQYYDKRGVFAFQPGEILQNDGVFSTEKGLIDFYLYLVIASEFDKMGYLEGSMYFDKAKAVMEQGKFDRFFTGWDRREELIRKIYGPNYKKFREMKDYYFYAMSIVTEDANKARGYVAQAVDMLQAVLLEDRDLDAAKQFIDAHYQEIIDLFADSPNKKPIQILLELDPDRKEVYNAHLN